ncbi:translation initiation factor IF-2 [Desulfurobacterium atlanticum]|uniref:Translation initiation factor IF-2 n=1 Tax=Desulfurobacterium atlanticum TaxID=240169 RepID=A0A238ZZP6_9BACT|nr:translation initiation factor IF-2 [Desulfurobacterium atlanticum]SNR88739.1 bacterial translation initiation factor 2 (bIF-2) [Desulfurobacterium atlanticum]
MAKTRVYQLAKELGMSSKELIEKLKNELDIQVKNAQSGLDEKQVMLVKEFIKPPERKIEKKPEKTKKEEIKKEEVKTEKPQTQVETLSKKEDAEKEKKELPPLKPNVPAEKSSERKRDKKPRKSESAKDRRKKDIRILSPEELAKRRKRRRPIRKREEKEERSLRDRENKKHIHRDRKPRPAPKPKEEEKITREQLEKLVASTKEQREKEKPKTEEAIIAERKREEKEKESEKHFMELMRKIEEKNRAKAKKRKKKKKKEEVVEEVPFEELSEEEQLQRLIEEEEKAKTVIVPEVISVRELAEKMGEDPNKLISDLIALGKFVTINQAIDFETVSKLVEKYGKVAKLEGAEEESEALLEKELEETEDRPEDLKPRPPVVTVMGHVDHGKTTLLDYIRNTKVAEREAGGITQHIGASVVEVETSEGKKKITFLDTPGHEAFTAMRARGAQITDIAILVVAADDGVMPQTIEAINHAQAAGVPIIVAINKIDKPGANPDRVKQELTQHGLIPEDWGGTTIMVPVSAKTGEGVDELLEMIALQAELMELKANPNKKARGVVLEAKLDKQRGPVATLLIQSGTLKVGDPIVAGLYSGKIRAMFDDKGKPVKEAGPSMAVEILGLEDVPLAGDKFYVVKDEKTARKIAEKRQELARESALEKEKRVSLEDLFAQIKEGEVKELNVVLKADAQGSIEAIRKSLEELSTDEVKVKIIHAGVGPITENDVLLAAASNAIIVGFNVRPDSAARKAAEREKVDMRTYRVIYDIVDEIKKAMQGLLEPEEKEVYLGSAEVRATFKVPKVGTVAGCYVKDGVIRRNANVRLVRDGVIIYDGKIASLKRFKDDVREVQAGYECGIGLENFNDIKVGDTIECYTVEKVERNI